MNNFLIIFILLFSIFTQASSYEFSVMTLNVQNLFDTLDDPKKDDKAYLPIKKKQSEEHQKSCENINVKSWKDECMFMDWNEETKDIKLRNLVKNIISYDNVGPDVLGLQEVENLNILRLSLIHI